MSLHILQIIKPLQYISHEREFKNYLGIELTGD